MAESIEAGSVKDDPLGEALYYLRMTGVIYCRSELSAPFSIDLPEMPDCMVLHLVTAGSCLLTVDGEAPSRISVGDLVLVPHGERYLLSSDMTTPSVGLFDLHREEVSERFEILRHGGDGDRAELLCTAVRFEHPAAYHLLKSLPKIISLESHGEDAWITSVMNMLADEASTLSPGGETVITRLADVLVIHVIRAWMRQNPAETGWLAALRDARIGRSITAMHRDPSRDWSVASLADEVAMSRSAFAARFTELVGESAMRYLTRWRMQLALIRLREKDDPLYEIAEDFGYQSEAAFSRAFKRCLGMSPGAARKQSFAMAH